MATAQRPERATDWVIYDVGPDPDGTNPIHLPGSVHLNGTPLVVDFFSDVDVVGSRTQGTLVGVSVPSEMVTRKDFGEHGVGIDTIAGVPVMTPAPSAVDHQPEEYTGPEGPNGEPGRLWTRVWVQARSVRFDYPEGA